MTVTISLPADEETKLKARALAAGQDVNSYLQQLIARELAAPLSLTEAAEPFASAVDAAGVSDEQFVSIVSEAQGQARRARRQNPT